ncbi:MAG: hypothetical protein M1818_000077 [Claussenomyces sp. TS43310]|nr:MAG: hypothetical protein M1818_000077 [Claussenomyces sp. TS43310]
MASDNEASSSSETRIPPSPKRSANAAGLNVNANGRPVKRRASKACQCCRQRKVRCNVVEHGAPCTNCRLDEVECIVTESKRRNKSLDPINELASAQPYVPTPPALSHAEALANGSVNPTDITMPSFARYSLSHSSASVNGDDDDVDLQHHVPHAIYQSQRLRDVESLRRASFVSQSGPASISVGNFARPASFNGGDVAVTPSHDSPRQRASETLLPPYIKALPPRMTSDDISYLYKKGALTIPEFEFRNELLRNYIEYVHPYMPLLELHDFLKIVDQGDGVRGKISLIVFQAVMFAGSAFIDMAHLRNAGYESRKAARKAFYQKARLLYDFDYECDRLVLVQSLLLMTYWYETPDDQKDTWHWMGVAISLAHTIGLHRNTEKSNMDPRKRKLWKRIWWSCFMRDRLVALGMRRPTRIKDGDYDVPMLEYDDFELESLPMENTIVPAACTLMRNVDMQRELAGMCIAKAKLTLCISHVLTAQYSVLIRDQTPAVSRGPESNSRPRVMLFPKKMDQTDEVESCDEELNEWVRDLPAPSRYSEPSTTELADGRATIAVQRALLHMVYFATVSALHRPQVLPSAESATLQRCRELQDESRKIVREASMKITEIACSLHAFQLERYLPTTGVTVLLPAIIIHLLDMKSHFEETRRAALQGFRSCMVVLEKLRDNYAAADYATQFLEAAIRKAGIDTGTSSVAGKAEGLGEGCGAHKCQPRAVPAVGIMMDAQRAGRLTPPMDQSDEDLMNREPYSGMMPPQSQGFSSATTPPASDSSNLPDSFLGHADSHLSFLDPVPNNKVAAHQGHNVVHFTDSEFEALINFDEGLDPDFMLPGDGRMGGETGGLLNADWMIGADQHLPWDHQMDAAVDQTTLSQPSQQQQHGAFMIPHSVAEELVI